MESIPMFILGLIVGWGIELVIDILFWRRNDNDARDAQIAQQQQEIEALQEQIQTYETETVQLRTMLNESRQRANKLQNSPAQVETIIIIPDRLQKVKGIGDVYARELNEAGIYTFEDLANSTPQQILDIVKPEKWQDVEPQEWIEEAKSFAKAKEK